MCPVARLSLFATYQPGRSHLSLAALHGCLRALDAGRAANLERNSPRMVWASLRKAAPSFVVGHIGSGAGTGGRNNMGRRRDAHKWGAKTACTVTRQHGGLRRAPAHAHSIAN